MSTTQTVQRSQVAGSVRPYDFDVGLASVTAWDEDMSIAASGIIRPSVGNGFVYTATAAGQTGALEPAWPITVGGTVTDGSLTWTAGAPPVTGQDTISTVTWTQVSPPDATLTITSETNTNLVASALIGAGTSGNAYTIEVKATMASGAIYIAVIVMTIL